MANTLKVIEVTTATCGICKMIDPIIKKVVEMQGPRIQFEKKTVDWDDEIVKKYNVIQVPTFLFLDGDTLLFRHTGVLTIQFFNEMINRCINQLSGGDEETK